MRTFGPRWFRTDSLISEYSDHFGQAADHLLALINGILDVTKIQAGNMEIEREIMDLGPVVESCVLITDAKAKEKNIMVSSEIDPRMPQLHADPLRVKQILINILGNAVKFTPPKGRVKFEASLAGGGFARLIV